MLKTKAVAILLVCSGLAGATNRQTQYMVYGNASATGPTLVNSNQIQVSDTGDIWTDYPTTSPQYPFYKVTLTVDGSVVWENTTNKQGVSVPNVGPPGLVFDYTDTYTLSSGSHTVVWQGKVTPTYSWQPNPPGDFYVSQQFNIN